MAVLYIILAIVCLGTVSRCLAQRNDKREFERLQYYLLSGQKNNPCVSIHRFAGYGGGWIEFADKCFDFLVDDNLFSVDKFISNGPFYKVVYRESM